ncbi:hypothetical protein ACFLXU_02180 [Chloroflexota bacterium]
MVLKTIAVLDPTAKPRVKESPISPRVHDLNGKVIGFLWNDKPNGDILLLRIKEQICKRFRLAGTSWQHGLVGPTADPAIIQELMHASDMVINAIAD